MKVRHLDRIVAACFGVAVLGAFTYLGMVVSGTAVDAARQRAEEQRQTAIMTDVRVMLRRQDALHDQLKTVLGSSGAYRAQVQANQEAIMRALRRLEGRRP